MDISKIKDYVPILATTVAALLTYSLGFRKGKQDKFNTQLEESLQEILSPILHAIRIIRREENAFQREKLLKTFFNNYSKENTKIFKMPSKYIHDWFYETEEFFYKFQKDRKQEDWETFWVYLDKFYIMINGEYSTVRRNIYSDYRWLIDLNQKNVFLRITMEFLILIYEGVKFLIGVCFIFILGFILDDIQGQNLIPLYFKKIVWSSFFLSILLFGVLMTVLANYSSAKQMQRDSQIKIFLGKKFPKVFKKIKKVMDIDIEKEKKKINIPSMYIE